MNVLLKAVVTGFGMSLGAALYKRAAKKLGLEDESEKSVPTPEIGVIEAEEGADADIPA